MELTIFKKSENSGKKTGDITINIASHGSITLNKFFCQATGIAEGEKVTLAQDEEKKWYLVVGHADAFELHTKRGDKSLAFSNAIIAQKFISVFEARAIDVLNGKADLRTIRSVACDISPKATELKGLNLYKINTDRSSSKVNFKK